MKLTAAQMLYAALGVHPQLLLLGHKIGRQPRHTKKGPGRKHQQGRGLDK